MGSEGDGPQALALLSFDREGQCKTWTQGHRLEAFPGWQHHSVIQHLKAPSVLRGTKESSSTKAGRNLGLCYSAAAQSLTKQAGLGPGGRKLTSPEL